MSVPLFRNRSFLLVFSGRTISAIGDMFGYLALSWFVYALSGSKLAMGGLGLAFALPQFTLRFMAGPFVDRWDRRRVMIVADVIRSAAYIVPPALFAAGRLQLWHLYGLAVVEGAMDPFFRPASMALLPSIVRPDQLVRANSLAETTSAVAQLVGPPLGGLVVSAFGAPIALLADGFSFFVSAVSLAFIPPVSVPGTESRRAFRREFAEGVAFYRRQPALAWMLLLLAVANFSWSVVYVLLLPFARDAFDASAVGYSLIISAAPLGALVGGALLTSIGEVRRRRLTMISALAWSGFTGAALAFTTTLPQVILLVGLAGLSIPFFNVLNATIFQRVTPDRLRGRVFSVRLILGQGLVPLGTFLGGVTGEYLGVRPAFLASGLLTFVIASLGLLVRSLEYVDGDLRSMEDTVLT